MKKAMLVMGQALLKSHDNEKAERLFLKYEEKYPEDFRGPLYRGVALTQAGRHLDAKDALIIATELQPNEAELFGSLGGVLIKLKEFTNAVKICYQGLDVDKHNELCKFNLNTALRALGRFHEAIQFTNTWIPPLPSILASERESSQSKERITYHCVKWGTKYDSSYVNRLYRMIRRNSHSSVRLLCHTEDPTNLLPEIISIPFPKEAEQLRSWWLKACIFDKETCTEDCLHVYLDLDIIISANMDSLFHFESSNLLNNFGTLDAGLFACEGRRFGINSSIIVWQGFSSSAIYDYVVSNFDQLSSVIYKFDHFLEMVFFKPTIESDSQCNEATDSTALFDCTLLQHSHPDAIVDYTTITHLPSVSNDSMKCNNRLSSTIIVCFPLHPKPHEISDQDLLKCWKVDEISEI